MNGLVDRATMAFEKHEERVEEQEAKAVKRFEFHVSRLLGEAVTGAARTSDGLFLLVQDGVYKFPFVFADEKKGVLALKLNCSACKNDFLLPVSTLADIGRLVRLKDAHRCEGCQVER